MQFLADKFSKINKLVADAEKILITSHISPDGDNIGSCIAIYEYLDNLDKKVLILNEDPIPDKFEFLKDNVKYQVAENQTLKDIDLIFMLDIGEYKRCGKVAKLLPQKTPIINIDHHISNDGFGFVNIVRPDIASCAQLVFYWLKYSNYKFSKLAVIALLTGIISDTGAFKYGNADRQVFSDVADLMSFRKDIVISELINRVMYSKSFKELHDVTDILNNQTKLYPNGLLYTFFNTVDYPDCDNDFLLDLVNGIKDAKITFFARQIAEHKIKISLRTKSDFNLSLFASRYEGGGHPKASGMTFEGAKDKLEATILNTLIKEFDNFIDNEKH